ncbi:MAG: hypothetical protein ACLFQ5_13600 [Oceanicaulis sp.]
MERWLNISTLTGLLFGLAFAITMSVMLGPLAGIPMGLGVGLMWAVVFNTSRTAGGTKSDEDVD